MVVVEGVLPLEIDFVYFQQVENDSIKFKLFPMCFWSF